MSKIKKFAKTLCSFYPKYMKKLVISLFVFISLAIPMQEAKALDAKSRAFMVMCTYGTVGGALLGFATMAFGSNSRAIAQGASLGLYGGIIFGSYVIMSHNKSRNAPGGGYPEEQGPGFNDQGPPPSGFGGGGYGGGGNNDGYGEEEGSGGFFGQRSTQINENFFNNYKLKSKRAREISFPIFVPLLNMQF